MRIHIRLYKSAGVCGMIGLLSLLWSCAQTDSPNTTENKESPKTEESANQSTRVQQKQLFTKVSNQHSGITFSNDIEETATLNYMKYLYAYNGGGVAVGDINNDGLDDVFFTANMKQSRLYLNQGELKFRDITDSAGIPSNTGWHTGVTMADVNADGYLDIYVCRSGPGNLDQQNLLFINNQNLGFDERAADFGLDLNTNSTQAVFFDYDLDGDLDVYIVNHLLDYPKRYEGHGAQRKASLSTSDRLMRNDGQNKFVDVTERSGLLNNAFGLNASVADFDQNGHPDIYVTSDFSQPDLLYLNQGNGKFKEELKQRTGHVSQYSMGSDAADINNDGWDDLMVVDMSPEDNFRHKMMMGAMQEEQFWTSVKAGNHYQYMYNTLQLNRGEAQFSEIAMMSNVSSTDWSWSPLFADFDNDGLKDLFITNGIKRDVLDNDYRFRITARTGNKPGDLVNVNLFDALDTYHSNKISNYAYQNKDGYRFQNATRKWGLDEKTFSNGAAYADFDNDGDLDLIINNVDQTASLYENNTEEDSLSNYLSIELKSNGKNKFGIGARVSIKSKSGIQYQTVHNSKGYLSSGSHKLLFGLGNAETIDELNVLWPGGGNSVIKDVQVNQHLVVQKEKTKSSSYVKGKSKPRFNKLNESILAFSHEEKPFNDMKRESLIPHKLSYNGPCLLNGDINGDGREDLFVGGAYGHGAKLFLQQKNGRFREIKSESFTKDKFFEDVDACFFDIDQDDDLDLYVVSGSNEFKAGSERYIDRLYLNDGSGNFSRDYTRIPELRSSGSVVRPYDYDGDGDTDLFVGARSIPGRYGRSPNSSLLKNEGGVLKSVTGVEAPMLSGLGMVNSACWANVDADAEAELIIVGEWMPITILDYNGHSFQNRTAQYGLEHTTGWWNTIYASDLDKDGDEDFLLGNIGLNYKFKVSVDRPLKLYLADFDKNGTEDIVLSYNQHGVEFPVRGRNCTMQQMPSIQQKFPNYSLFAQASLSQIYGPALMDAQQLQANMFESIALMNRGNGNLKIQPLPTKAQLSSINDFLVEDYNGDERPDILLAGNLYHSEAETPRADASYGLLLEGVEGSRFKSRSPMESGIDVKGEVKHLIRIPVDNNKAYVFFGINNGKLRGYTY